MLTSVPSQCYRSHSTSLEYIGQKRKCIILKSFTVLSASTMPLPGTYPELNSSSPNATHRASSSTRFSTPLSQHAQNSTLYSGLDDLGDLVPCVGPTPPPNLTFPIETVVEKVFEVDGPTTKAVLNSPDSGSWYWATSTYTAATTSYSTWTRQQVPQLNPYLGDKRPCCGMCSVYISLVDVFYWPVSGANTACLSSISPITTQEPQISTSGGNNSMSIAVGPDGFT